MTYDLIVGGKNVYCVSGSTRDIFQVVKDKLENGTSGSKFPLFQKLQSDRVHWNQVSKVIDELGEIQCKLTPIPYPVALFYIGDLEIDYRSMHLPDGLITGLGGTNLDFGFDEKGLFKQYSNLIRQPIDREYTLEVTRDNPDFKHYLFNDLWGNENAVDRIVHGFKSAGYVYESTIHSLYDIAHNASIQRKSIISF